ncbi:MAG TPA: hypothetical protein VJR92_05835 [Gemmatimonadaceae bacterium]|nr:hypothetical protein [Gemmatimonadaceae bacterium]
MKSTQLQIRVTPTQKARLRQLASRAGQDVSAYVLARALPAGRVRFDDAVRALADESRRRFALAEVADVLGDAPLTELQLDLAPRGLERLSPFAQNYLAALVEQACVTRGAPLPAWTTSIAPLDEPWFASDLRSLRAHLLVASPPPFKRRNLFTDPGVAGRV